MCNINRCSNRYKGNALLHLLSSLVTQKYMHYSIGIATEQVLDIRKSLMQKSGFSEMCHDFGGFADWVTYVCNLKYYNSL